MLHKEVLTLAAEEVKTSYFNNLKIIFRSRNFVVVLLTNYTSAIFFAAWIYLNLFFRDIGISYFEIGFANGWAMLVGILATMLGGYWADHKMHHRKYMAAFNKLIIALMSLIIPFVNSFEGALIVWTIFGFGSFFQASIDPILFESLPSEQLGTATSLFTITGIFGVLGLTIVGFLIMDNFVFGIRLFWLIAAIGSFIDFIIRMIFLEQREEDKKIKSSTKNNFTYDLLTQYKSGFKVLIATIPIFFFIFLLDVASDSCYQFAQNFFLNEDVGMNYSSINYTMIGSTIIGVIGGLIAGPLLDKSQNTIKVMFFAYFLLPLSVLLLYFSPVFPNWFIPSSTSEFFSIISSTASIAVIIKSGNDVVWRTIAWGAIGKELPREHTGKVMAILAMSVQLLGVIINPFIGFIYQLYGGKPLLLIVLGLNLAILLLLLSSWLKTVLKQNSLSRAYPTESSLK